MTDQITTVSEPFYAIIANLAEPDGSFRVGAKCWIIFATGGEGDDRFKWFGMSIGGRYIEKWAPTSRFKNFRARLVPEKIRHHFITRITTRQAAIDLAKRLNAIAEANCEQHEWTLVEKCGDTSFRWRCGRCWKSGFTRTKDHNPSWNSITGPHSGKTGASTK